MGFHIHTKGWGLIGGANGWCVVCYLIIWGFSGWCVVCIGKRLENGVVVVCEKINERCEHDELRDMKCFMPMRKEVFLGCNCGPLFKNYLFQHDNLKLIEPTTQN